uniref:Uncharacterized protein n=1 Tax=Anguilla anguilla TaxID=7936 RepID=A0A0E9S4X3_ANGAN
MLGLGLTWAPPTVKRC